MSEQDITQLVRAQLLLHDSERLHIEVLADGVRKDGDWWHVPVRPTTDAPRTYEYYDRLSEVEDELTESKHVRVLLVPAA